MGIEQVIGPVASVIVGALGAWLTFAQLKKHYTDEIDEKINQANKSADKALESEIRLVDQKLDAIKSEVQGLEDSLNKEIAYVKEAYKGEIKNLSEKIELLRDQVQDQHKQLVSLLSKLISEK